MQFFGVTVPAGETVDVNFDGGAEYMHLTQAALGADAKTDTRATVSLIVEGQKFAIGTLSFGVPHFALDLVVGDSFKVSHTGKTAITLTGYKTELEDFDELDDGDDDEEEDDDDDALAMRHGLMSAMYAGQGDDGDGDDDDDDGEDDDDHENGLGGMAPGRMDGMGHGDDDDEDDDDEDGDDGDEDDDNDDEDGGAPAPSFPPGAKRPAPAAFLGSGPAKKPATPFGGQHGTPGRNVPHAAPNSTGRPHSQTPRPVAQGKPGSAGHTPSRPGTGGKPTGGGGSKQGTPFGGRQ